MFKEKLKAFGEWCNKHIPDIKPVIALVTVVGSFSEAFANINGWSILWSIVGVIALFYLIVWIAEHVSKRVESKYANR